GRELLHSVEAAPMDLPGLVVAQVVVERHEVEGGPDPHDPGDHVQPAREEREPFVCVVTQGDSRQRSRAIATSSSSAVSSSSSRERSSRSRRASRTSAFERRLTKTTKRKPNFSS